MEKIHELKCWPKYFNDIINDFKNFEIRKNDRDFKLFDILLIKEWDPNKKEYTSRCCTRQIKYILNGGEFGIEKNYVILGLQKY